MMEKKPGLVLGLFAGVVGTILIAIAVWLGVTYTGTYNVAATDRHADLVRWTLDTTMHRSVANRAEALTPPEIVSAELVAAGAETYASTCAHCHGAPGSERAHWASNMRPLPPELVEAAAEWDPEEVFWIVQNGIKMSGMPAFGPEHGEDEIWGIAAFVKQLPGMTPEAYQAAAGSAGHGG